MTRGQLIFLLDKDTYIISPEFNGGMYLLVDQNHNLVNHCDKFSTFMCSLLEELKSFKVGDFKESVNFSLEQIRELWSEYYPDENLEIKYVENNEEEIYFDFHKLVKNKKYYNLGGYSQELFLINLSDEDVVVNSNYPKNKGVLEFDSKEIVIKSKEIGAFSYGMFLAKVNKLKVVENSDDIKLDVL